MAAPPSSYGTILQIHADDTVDVWTGGRKLKVNVTPGVDPAELRRGREVVLNEALNVVDVGGGDPQGEIVRLKDRLDEARVMVTLRADEERVVELSAGLGATTLQAGDLLRLDAKAGVILEKLPKAEVEDLVLEEVPNITYTDIGGLAAQIDQIRDAIELPVLYAEHFAVHKLSPPKGVLLYGPPGCGKTLIAKAVANALAQQLSQQTGQPSKAYFLNVKGPELLNKYVGETERKIREIFATGAGEGQRRRTGGDLLRRDGFPLPDPRLRHLLGRRVHHRPAVPGGAGRGGGAPPRDRDRGQQPPGSH